MPEYIVQGKCPELEKMSANELQDTSKMSSKVVQDIDSDIQWNHSYVTGDKIYCEYIAAN